MRKHFLILMLFALLPFTAWADNEDITGYQAVLTGNADFVYDATDKLDDITTVTLKKEGAQDINIALNRVTLTDWKNASNQAVTEAKGAGTYTCTVTIANTSGGPITGTLEIEKKMITYTGKAKTIKYYDAVPTNFETVADDNFFAQFAAADVQTIQNVKSLKPGVIKSGSVTFLTDYTKGSPVSNANANPAVAYYIRPVVTTLVSDNYRFGYADGVLTVEAKTLSITGNNATATATVSNLTYNSQARMPKPTVTDKEAGELAEKTSGQNPQTKDYELSYYAAVNGAATGNALSADATKPAGNYVVRVTGANNYTGSFDLLYTVNKKTVWVTTLNNSATKTYSAGEHTITGEAIADYLSFENLEDADKAVVSNVKVNKPAAAAYVNNSSIAIDLWKNNAKVTAIDAGDYQVHAYSVNGGATTTDDNVLTNYRVVYQNVGTYTISPAEITFTLKAQNKVYGQSHPLDAGVTPTGTNQGDYFSAITDLKKNDESIAIYPTLSKGAKVANTTNKYAIAADFTNVRINRTTGQAPNQVVTDITSNYTFKTSDNNGVGVYTIAKGFMAVRPVNLTATYGEFAANEHKAFAVLASGGDAADNTAVQALALDKVEFVKTNNKIKGTKLDGTGTVEYPAAGIYTLKINTTGLELGDLADNYDFEWFDGSTYTITKAPLTITLADQALKVGSKANADATHAGLEANDKTIDVTGLQYEDAAADLYDDIAFAFAGHVLDQTAAQAATYYTKGEVKTAQDAYADLDNNATLTAAVLPILNAANNLTGNDAYTTETLKSAVTNAHVTAFTSVESAANSDDPSTVVKTAEVPATPKYVDANGVLIAAAANYQANLQSPAGLFADGITLANTVEFANYLVDEIVKGDLQVSAANAAVTFDIKAAALTQITNNVGKKVDAKISNNTNKRTLYADQWNAVVLPFDITPYDFIQAIGTYAVFDVLQTGGDALNFKITINEIPAYTPFLVKVDKKIELNTKTFADVVIKAIDEEALTQSTSTAANYKFVGTVKKDNYGPISWNIQPNDANGGIKLAYRDKATEYSAFTAYVTTIDGQAPTNAPQIFIEEADGSVTAISTINADGVAMKADGWYTINGMKLEGMPTEKGIYINNGKKVVVK
ncbi:MAG: hypothetical protein J6N98_08230 [Prevotella sp.]|nr:hypothetical protein [Prevotella sp.]